MSSYADPASGLVAITPSDSTNIEQRVRAIYVGTGGDISILCHDTTQVTLVGVQAGSLLPIYPKRVNSTGTTASDIVGLL